MVLVAYGPSGISLSLDIHNIRDPHALETEHMLQYSIWTESFGVWQVCVIEVK